MSGKKPPPRPPLPKGLSPNTKTVNTPGRLRSALASISIRYNPTTAATKDSDSEEEIYIVRKEENSEVEQKNELQEVESDEIDQNTRVTEDCDYEPSKQRPNIPNSSSGPSPLLKLSTESLNGVEKGLENGDKRTIVKQQTWPGNSIGSATGNMRFMRRDHQGAKNDPAIKTNENKEEADSGSQPSKTHLSLSSTEKGSSDQKEGNGPRSPSPFRRLYRQPNNEHVGEKLAASSSAISLSSLLAAAATDDHNTESEKEIQEVEYFQDAMAEPSGVDSVSSEKTEANARLKTSENPSVITRPIHEPPCSFLLFCILLFYIYYISDPPVFVDGMIAGSVVSYLVGCLILLVLCPEDSFDERFQRELDEYNMRVALSPKPSYTSVDPGLLLRPRGMKGWMLKAYDYDPNSISETTLVYARLRDNNLTLSLPKQDSSSRKIDIKTVDENATLPFIRHDHFDITGSKVSLTPLTLSPKRIWSKKYPLCLALANPGKEQEAKELSDEDLTKQKFNAQSSLDEVNVLYLFAKTGRQKEEWYQHFDRVLSPKKNVSASVSDIDNALRPSSSSCSYPHYMAKLLPNPDIDMQDSPEVQLSWVNMLFGRVFWDVWQDRYWADKIKQRFQNKLSKLHKPQFIRDIHITDLSLGHTFPLINKVSLPVLDEQGTWVDFDVTYSGGVVFTVETHLNIDGYLTHFLNLGKENRNITGDLDMAELSQKYEMVEKEECLPDLTEPSRDIGNPENENEEDDEGSLTSESPPESDSDFESPESDLEELTSKKNGSRPNSSGSDSTEAMYAKEALMQLKSLEGFLEKQIREEEEMHMLDVDEVVPPLRLSQESLSNPESIPNSGTYSPVQKQSSGEDSEKLSSFFSPPSTPKINRAPKALNVSSPVRQRSRQPEGTRKKLIGVLEKLAKSKWVKKAAETKIVKTAAEKFSNLPIILSVEVQSVKGTLTLNIPPPPTNRLWYGFRGNPMLFVTARPKLGARQVKLTHVTDWIERKLKQEFKNMFVLPNMEDIPIKIMNSDVEKQFSEN